VGKEELATSPLRSALAIVLPALFLATGCSLETSRTLTADDELQLEGVWDGVSVNSCDPLLAQKTHCGAVHRISFTILDANAKFSGFYHCAPGNTPCYNRADSGVVNRGLIQSLQHRGRGLWFRVMRDDHSSCLFNALLSPNRLRGGFYCFGVERGFWQVERSY
jgi:hypothetical protein